MYNIHVYYTLKANGRIEASLLSAKCARCSDGIKYMRLIAALVFFIRHDFQFFPHDEAMIIAHQKTNIEHDS